MVASIFTGIPSMIYDNVLILKPEMVEIDDSARVDSFTKIEGGLGVHIGPGVHISSFAHVGVGGGRVVIGANAAVTSGAVILSGTNTMAGQAMSSAAPAEMQVVERKTTTIGECAFIGTKAIVYPGVTVGRYAVVKAGSIVTKNVADYAVVAGAPAVVVGHREQQGDGSFVTRYLPKLREIANARDVATVQEVMREKYDFEPPARFVADFIDYNEELTREMTP